jgi:hypothetical protein
MRGIRLTCDTTARNLPYIYIPGEKLGKLMDVEKASSTENAVNKLMMRDKRGMMSSARDRTRHANTSSAIGMEMASIFARPSLAPEESVSP